MRLFTLLAILLLTGGAFLLVDGGLRVSSAMDAGGFSLAFWTGDFWWLIPGKPTLGLGPNAHWFVRLLGGLLAMSIGGVIMRVSAR